MDHLPDSPAIEPLSKRLRLTLERPPPTSDPVTGEPRILFDYGEQGEPIWQTKETDEEILGKTVKRIWDDKGGLAKFDEASLRAAIDRGEEMTDEAEAKAKKALEEENEDRYRDGLSLEQMKQLKLEIADRLGQASHTLGNLHHILTLLLPTSLTTIANPNPAHALPPHIPLAPSMLSTSQTHSSGRPKSNIITTASDLLAQRQDSLRQTADLFRSGARELEQVVEVSQKEWETALEVREGGGWALGLKDNRQAGFGGVGGERGSDAKDWQALYGLDHSHASFRAKHFAQLAPTTGFASTSTQPSGRLSFPNRSYRRLLVTMQTIQPDGSSVIRCSQINSSTAADSNDVRSVTQEMSEAMWEATDEETFSEILAESRSSSLLLPAELKPYSLTLSISPFLTLTISLHSVSTPLPPTATVDPYTTFLSTLFTLSLLSLHAYRRQYAHYAQHPVKDPAKTAVIQRPSVLRSVVEQVQFGSFGTKVRSWLKELREGVSGWGSEVSVEWEGVAGKDGDGKEVDVLAELELRPGGSGRDIRVREKGQKVTITLALKPPIDLRLTPPSQLTFSKPFPTSTSDASNPTPTTIQVPIADLAHLSQLLSTEIQHAVCLEIVARFTPSSPADKSHVAGMPDVTSTTTSTAGQTNETGSGKTKHVGFVDALSGSAVLQGPRGELRIHPTVIISSSTGTTSLRLEATLSVVSDPKSASTSGGLHVAERLAWSSRGAKVSVIGWVERLWKGLD